jgi:WD40 repeat protein
MTSSTQLTEVCTIAADPEFVSAVDFSADGTLLASGGGMGSTMKLWSVGKWQEKMLLRTLSHGTRTVHFFADSKRLIAGTQEATWLFDVRKGDALDYFETAGCCRAISLSDGEHFVTFGRDARLRLWELNNQKPVFESKKLKGWGGPVACSADGRLCAAGTGTGVSLWDLGARKEVHLLRGHKKEVRALAFSPDGAALASGAGDGKMLLWNVSAGELAGTIELGKRQEAWSLAYCEGGRAVAVGSGDGSTTAGKISIWETTRCQLRGEAGPQATPFGIAASADGRWLAAAYGHGGQVKIWTTA